MKNRNGSFQGDVVNAPAISIILPFYNSGKTLQRALNSIKNQSFTDFECILIDNNSSDESAEIVSGFCDKDKRFRLVNEEKQGVVHAFNKGLNKAKGKFIARMDADDWCFPDRFMKQTIFLENHKEYDVVAGLAKFVGHKSNTEGFDRYVDWSNSIMDFKDILLKQFMESPIINPTVMWRKEVSDQYGSYEDGDFPEDYELWLRWLEKGVKIYKLPEMLIHWHDSENRLTRIDAKYSDEAFFNIKTLYLAKWLKIHNPFHPNVVVWGASKISRNRAKALKVHEITISAYIDISEKRQLEDEIIYYKDLPSPQDIFILVYLKEETMRAKTQQFLEEKNFVEGRNYLLLS